MRYSFRTRIPLVGACPSKVDPKSPLGHALAGKLTRSDVRRIYTDIEQRTRPFTQLKPTGYLGAPWIDSFVALGKSVSLCETCNRRYWKWWERAEYRPIWSLKELTDCDGCGTPMLYCTGFYAASLSRSACLPQTGLNNTES